MIGYVANIEEQTIKNENFRKVLYTAAHNQLVLMSLKPGEEIGNEVHEDVDQFFRFEQGEGKVVLGNSQEHQVSDGFAVVIPANTWHNVINTGNEALKLYTIYSPPHHPDATIHQTKAEAEAAEKSE